MPLVVQDVGVRECFRPRPGFCYLDADIEGLELCTLAQVEIWTIQSRRKADRLNADECLHCHTAATILNTDYRGAYRLAKGEKDPRTGQWIHAPTKQGKETRNLAKVPNFGKPGGMADKTLVAFARSSYGIRLGATAENPRPTQEQAEAEAVRIGHYWARANPDDVEYLQYVRTLKCPGGMYMTTIPGSTVRRKGTYCAIANTHFQGLGAVVAGKINWALAWACYTDMDLPGWGRRFPALRQCRVVSHAYDEWLLECPIGLQTQAGAELEWIVVTVGGTATPDVRLKTEAVAMSAWSKAAERVEKDGELLIWTPDMKRAA